MHGANTGRLNQFCATERLRLFRRIPQTVQSGIQKGTSSSNKLNFTVAPNTAPWSTELLSVAYIGVSIPHHIVQ
jgi:hypothetical protein